MKDDLNIWVVYERPLDYPGGFIARRFELDSPTTDIRKGESLNAVRDQLPPGLTRIDRDPNDEPQIVECWL